MPGPKMPPEPPDPIDSEVVRIFTSGRASTIQMALAARARRCPGAEESPHGKAASSCRPQR
jgi:hypothetical protein